MYYDVAWTEYLRELGFDYQTLIERELDTVLARTTLEFKSPARFDDILEIYTRVSTIRNTSMIFDFEIYPADEDRLIGTANTLYVCIDPKTLKPIQVPGYLRESIGRFEGKDLS
jgi:acyl-CoA thioester hydrolase